MTRPNSVRLLVALAVLSALACLDPRSRARQEQLEARRTEWAVRSHAVNEVADLDAGVPDPGPAPTPTPLDVFLDLPPDVLLSTVASKIAWEPYAGVLRGPSGTAAAKSGSAWDMAFLIGEALAEQGVPARYAYAVLPDEAVTALLARLPSGPAVVGTTPYDPTTDAALRERVRPHVWVEAQVDGSWVALDPTRPDVLPGSTWTPALSTSEFLPEEAFHLLRIDVVQRTANGEETTIGAVQGDVREFVDGLSLVVLGAPRIVPVPAPSAADPTGLGEGLDQGIKGLGLSAPAPALKPGTRGAVEVRRTLTGPAGPQVLPPWTERTADASGAVVAEWLQITLTVPGQMPRVIHRPLWEAADGPVASHRRYAIGVFPREVSDDDVAAARAAVEAVPSDDESEEARGEAVARFAVVAVAAAMDAVSQSTAAEIGVSVVRHQPRIYVAALETSPGESAATTEVSIDLGLDEVDAIPFTGAPDTTASLFQQARGLASSTVEGEVLEALTGVPARTTARVTQAAAAEGIPLRSLGIDNGTDGLDMPPGVADLITAALEAGRAVVVPERAVTLDGRPTWGWWEVDLETGALVGVMEGGGHQAVLEYTVTVGEEVLDEDRAYVMGLIAGAVATEGLLSLMAIKYEFAAITPEIAKEIAVTLESIVCKVCPSGSIGYGGGIEVKTDCYKVGGLASGVGAGANISFCDAYLEGVKCSMALVLGGVKSQIPGVSGSSGGKLDIPFSCGGD